MTLLRREKDAPARGKKNRNWPDYNNTKTPSFCYMRLGIPTPWFDDDEDYHAACEQLWAIREGLA